MSKFFSSLCTLLLIVVFTPSKAHADTFVITGGTLTVTGAVGGPVFDLSGNNFFVSGRGGERGASAPQVSCLPCTPGKLITVGGIFAGSSLGFGASTFDGVDYGAGHGGVFEIQGPQIEVPFSLSNFSITSPFTFSGHLRVCPQDCFFGPVVFSADLIGSGTATIDLIVGILNEKPIYTFQKVTYNFEVPEPASILLLGGGLAALGARLRHRGRRRR